MKKGRENPNFTISGKLVHNLLAEPTRQIQMFFNWPDTVLYRANVTLWSVLQMAFDLTPFPDLKNNTFALHALQLLDALFYNRAQGHKLAIMTYGSTLGYRPAPTSAHVARLLRDCYLVAYLVYIISPNVATLFEVDQAYLVQAVDGLQRSASSLPGLARSNVLNRLQAISTRLKKGSIRHSTILLSVSALLQPELVFEQELPVDPPTESAFAALLTDTIPDFRRAADALVPSSVPVPSSGNSAYGSF